MKTLKQFILFLLLISNFLFSQNKEPQFIAVFLDNDRISEVNLDESKFIDDFGKINNLLKLELKDTKAVSYTHLDVYKRQVVENITQKEFEEKYLKPRIPVVLKGNAKNWPAYEKWTLDYMKEVVGDTEVPLYDLSLIHI